ncbi:MAG: AbrB family transcriptional regulator [Alphaproteobacteria bacterium TMED150]|nr:AbrB family transcriptional regulator [Paracoccaceae bacterium]RPH13506.1 MAG: AbrB family transcriptional regulator [Alphaproteobacteria bacterium TMED150]|tara:strand:+ start:8755 stop:9861 length:1107 start_codon:yes stop_codon:yes gene_type:complete
MRLKKSFTPYIKLREFVVERQIKKVIFALFLGGVSGYLFYLASLPLPWMLGAMFINIIAALLRLPVAGPTKLRPTVAVVIGVMLGSSFTPTIFDQIIYWVPSLIFMALYLFVTGLVIIPYYRKVAGFDLSTAYFAGMPGGLMEMMIIGKEMGADERSIILAHTSRIVLVVALVAVWFRVVQGIDLMERPQFGTPLSHIPAIELITLSVVGVLGYFLGRFVHLPAPMLLGPIIVSAAVHVLGFVENPPPSELVVIAQIFLGTIFGCRFTNAEPKAILRAIWLGLGATLLMLTLTFGFAIALHEIFEQSVEELVLAYSPGGLAEMSLVALAMNADVAYVSTHHVVRVSLIMLVAPLLFRFLLRSKEKSSY